MHNHHPKTCCTVTSRQTAQIMARIIFIIDKNATNLFFYFPKYNFSCDMQGNDDINFTFFHCVFFFRVIAHFFYFWHLSFYYFVKIFNICTIRYYMYLSITSKSLFTGFYILNTTGRLIIRSDFQHLFFYHLRILFFLICVRIK